MTNLSQLHAETTGCLPEAGFSIKLRVISLVEVSTHQLYLAAIVLSAIAKWSEMLRYIFLFLFFLCKIIVTILIINFTSYPRFIIFLQAFTSAGFNAATTVAVELRTVSLLHSLWWQDKSDLYSFHFYSTIPSLSAVYLIIWLCSFWVLFEFKLF